METVTSLKVKAKCWEILGMQYQDEVYFTNHVIQVTTSNHNRHFPSPNYNITNLYSKKARSSPFESTVGEKTTMAIGKLEVERFD